MTSAQGPKLFVDADLHLTIEHPSAADVGVRIVGDGDQLRVTADHPVRLMRHSAPLVRTLRSDQARGMLDRLADAGLTVTIAGPRRDLIRFGAAAGRSGVRLVVAPAAPRIAFALAVVAATLTARRLLRRAHTGAGLRQDPAILRQDLAI